MKVSSSFVVSWLVATAVLAPSVGRAANPVLHGFADPAVRVHGDTLYMAVGKDLSPTTKGFAMPYWAIYSTKDLVTWKQEKVIDPALVSYMGAGNLRCWASDLTFHDDRFYFYFSDGGQSTGVLVADRPDGTYRDVLQRPLVPAVSPRHGRYDPTVFTDTDGTSYLIFGRDGHVPGEAQHWHYQIARLQDDMVSLAEAPRDLMTDQPYGFGDARHATDHSYLHKYKDTYYLSRDQVYMTSRSVYGPYARPRKTGQIGHSAFASFQGQWYHAYEFTDDQYGVRTYRQVMFTYLHYRDNGDMVDDRFFLKGGPGFATGVGNYDAAWDRIEAEWFFAIGGAEKRDGPDGGFEVRAQRSGAYITFPKVHHVAPKARITFNAASDAPRGGAIAVHQGSPDGPLLGRCTVTGSGAPRYQSITCDLRHSAGDLDLCIVLDRGLRLDWLTFKTAP